jgi:site-specific DNA-methyltransferase (adenine-specific)
LKPYYSDEWATLYCARWEDVGLPKCDMVLTDPPYNAINRETGGLRMIDKGAADSEAVDLPVLVAALAATGAHTVYGWCSSEQLSEWLIALQAHGFTTRTGVWWKTNPSPMNGDALWLSAIEVCAFGRRAKATFTRHCEGAVWRGPLAEPNGHPTPKPVWLMQSLIQASSNPGDLVLDPFAGGGATLYAAKQLNRRAVGVEMNERYCEIIARRLSQEVLLLDGAA